MLELLPPHAAITGLSVVGTAAGDDPLLLSLIHI